MTMSFDPDKVERFYRSEDNEDGDKGMVTDTMLGNYVRGADYDKLLALYREALAGIRESETLDNRRT